MANRIGNMGAKELCDYLAAVEADSSYQPDTRKMMSDERCRLMSAVGSGDDARIRAALSEAKRVARMWLAGEYA